MGSTQHNGEATSHAAHGLESSLSLRGLGLPEGSTTPTSLNRRDATGSSRLSHGAALLRATWWLSARKDDYDYVCDRRLRYYTDRVLRTRELHGREYKMADITTRMTGDGHQSSPARSSRAHQNTLRRIPTTVTPAKCLLYYICVNSNTTTLLSIEQKFTRYTVQNHVRPHADETVPSLATTDNLSPGRATRRPSMETGIVACVRATRDCFKIRTVYTVLPVRIEAAATLGAQAVHRPEIVTRR